MLGMVSLLTMEPVRKERGKEKGFPLDSEALCEPFGFQTD